MKTPTITLVDPIPNFEGLDSYECGRPQFRLIDDFYFYIDKATHRVPAGLVYDHASVPRGLWNVFPPYDPKYAAAALIHDWAYQGEFWPRDINDKLFLAAMKSRNVPVWKRGLMYAAVRVGGAFTYKNHTIKSVMECRNLSGILFTRRPLWDSLIGRDQ